MATGLDNEFERATSARLTDEDIERDRLLVGLDTASRAQEYFSTATPEVIRNFAASYGDDNPLFSDPEHGETTRWGGQIAPPQAAAVLNRPLHGDPIDPEIKQRARGAYKGVHSYVSGGSWDWYRPIHAGDTIFSFEGLESLDVRPSEFAGRSVFRIWRRVKFNQRAEVVGVYRKLNILAERRTARQRGKYSTIEAASYSQEDLDKIDAVYAQERPRGPEPRFWEDVQVGEALPEMVKGPLTTTDIIVFHAGGYGFHPYGLKTGRPNYENRLRIPGFYVKDDHGIPDVAQRVHWDSQWANAVGNPMAYDYGVLRECWIQHLVTNWMGDDGFLAHQEDEIRKFNYLGDTTWLGGNVTRKRVEGDRYLVDLEVRATNQRGEQTAIAHPSVVLPSRAAGPAVLPPAPVDLDRRASEILTRHAQLERQRRRAS